MAQPVQRMGKATRIVLTFAGELVLALALLAFVFVTGLTIVLLLVIPLLVVLIYLLPGHGEASRGRSPPSGG